MTPDLDTNAAKGGGRVNGSGIGPWAVWKIAPIKAPTGRTIITSAKEAACRVALMTTTKEEAGETGRRPYCRLRAL